MMTNTLVVHTLGNITVATGHAAEPLPLCPQEQALLAYLAHENCAVSRDFLCDLFWPGYPVENARRNLRKLLLLARRHLGQFLITEREQIALNPAHTYWVDSFEFQQQLGKADGWTAGPSALTTTTAKHLQQAVQLYRGDFLASLKQPESETYAAWLQQQQDLLHQQAQQAFAHYAAFLTSQGSYGNAVEVWQKWLRAAPYDETAHQQVLTLLAGTKQVHKALRHYEHYRHKLEKELAEKPGVELTALYEQLRVGFLPEVVLERKPEESLAKSLLTPLNPENRFAPPAPMTSLIGADESLAKIVQTLQSTTLRLVTLVGPGGIGKTHTALTVAQQLQMAYAHGLYFIPLAPHELCPTAAALTAPKPTPTGLLASLAQALPIPVTQEQPLLQQVLHHFRSRAVLLIFDGFEQVMAEAPFLQELLSQAPQVVILVTSRERLHLAGEMVIEIPPLSICAAPGASLVAAESSAALQLFVAKACEYDDSFRLTGENLPHIHTICRLVGGLPLAIEMAAAWVGHLQCAEIAATLQQSFSLLTHDKRGIPDRHRSIDALFQQTWEQLSPLQQEGLLHLVCFVGPFSRQAAQQAMGITLPVLKSLTDSSLLRLYKGEQYELQPLFRRWVYQKQQERCLAGDRSRTKFWKSYCHYFLMLVARETSLPGIDPDNIRQAWQQALVLNQYHLLVESLEGLTSYYRRLGLLGEASLSCEVIAQQAQQALTKAIYPNQQSLLACLLTRCRDILQAIHREIDESVLANRQLPTWDQTLAAPLALNGAEAVLVDPSLSILPVLAEGENLLPLR